MFRECDIFRALEKVYADKCREEQSLKWSDTFVDLNGFRNKFVYLENCNSDYRYAYQDALKVSECSFKIFDDYCLSISGNRA